MHAYIHIYIHVYTREIIITRTPLPISRAIPAPTPCRSRRVRVKSVMPCLEAQFEASRITRGPPPVYKSVALRSPLRICERVSRTGRPVVAAVMTRNVHGVRTTHVATPPAIPDKAPMAASPRGNCARATTLVRARLQLSLPAKSMPPHSAPSTSFAGNPAQ